MPAPLSLASQSLRGPRGEERGSCRPFHEQTLSCVLTEHGTELPDTKRTPSRAEGHFGTIRGSGEPHTGELKHVRRTHKQRCIVRRTQQKCKSRGTAADMRAAERRS